MKSVKLKIETKAMKSKANSLKKKINKFALLIKKKEEIRQKYQYQELIRKDLYHTTYNIKRIIRIY